MPRQRNKRGLSVTLTPSNGQWVGFVTVGRRGDGSPDRRKRASAMCAGCKVSPRVGCDCYEACADKVRELEDQVAAKQVARAGKVQTLGQYLDAWLERKQDRLAYKAFVSYRSCAARLTAQLGGTAVHDLGTTEISRALKAIARDVSANEANKVHRVLRSALSDYEREHPNVRNMAKLVKPLPVVEEEIVPLRVDEVQRIFAVIEKRRTRARWYVAIACGLRQGEALGLAWHRTDRPDLPSDLDLEAGTLTVREKQYRRTWEHGCTDAHACGQRLHKTQPCPDPCRRHTRACPPPCPASCVGHASSCPQRHSGGLVKGEPKNRKRRVMALPENVRRALAAHLIQQQQERELAGSKWVDTGHVFTTPFGRPVDARRDWGEWKEILAEAGLRDLRVHDARHTAATFNRLLKVDARVVQGLMGWSTSRMQERYEHVVDDMMIDAATRMNDLLWPAAPGQTVPDPTGTGSATESATGRGAKILQFRPRAS